MSQAKGICTLTFYLGADAEPSMIKQSFLYRRGEDFHRASLHLFLLSPMKDFYELSRLCNEVWTEWSQNGAKVSTSTLFPKSSHLYSAPYKVRATSLYIGTHGALGVEIQKDRA